MGDQRSSFERMDEIAGRHGDLQVRAKAAMAALNLQLDLHNPRLTKSQMVFAAMGFAQKGVEMFQFILEYDKLLQETSSVVDVVREEAAAAIDEIQRRA